MFLLSFGNGISLNIYGSLSLFTATLIFEFCSGLFKGGPVGLLITILPKGFYSWAGIGSASLGDTTLSSLLRGFISSASEGRSDRALPGFGYVSGSEFGTDTVSLDETGFLASSSFGLGG